MEAPERKFEVVTGYWLRCRQPEKIDVYSGLACFGAFGAQKEPVAKATSFFERDVVRAHLIRDLKGDFGIKDEGIDIILHVVEQLHGVRLALEELHHDMRDLPARAHPNRR